jgi:hypothetical protein
MLTSQRTSCAFGVPETASGPGQRGPPLLRAFRFPGAEQVDLANFLELSEHFSPAVLDYWTRVRSRPAFQAAKRVQIRDMAEELASLVK